MKISVCDWPGYKAGVRCRNTRVLNWLLNITFIVRFSYNYNFAFYSVYIGTRLFRYRILFPGTIISFIHSVKFCFCDAVGLEKMSESSTALQQKATRLLTKDAFDRDSLPTGRSFDRITTILDQLRREGATSLVDVERRHDDGPPSSVRAELDSFAALINKLSSGSAAGISRPKTSARSDVEDFWTRMAHTRGDLDKLESLVRRTFGSSHHAVVSHSPLASVSVEPVFIFHDKKV